MPNHPRQLGELKDDREASLRLGSGGFRGRRGGGVGRGSLGRSAASGLGRGAATALSRSAAARLATTAAMLAEAAEELELATTARAATARLGSRATAGLFNNRATAARLRSGAGRA